ncbi:MAG: hypothetical protein ACK50Q_05530 [Labrys sp. (in: a-proteobacteria)]
MGRARAGAWGVGPMSGVLRLDWSHGTAEVLPTAAMLRTVSFRLATGQFTPFAEPTWAPDEPGAARLSGHMRHLGGDFVCLPFGGGGAFSRSAPGWEPFVVRPADSLFHGRSADVDWTVAHVGENHVTLTLDEPEPSPIARLERTIAAVPGEPALAMRLVIHARRACRLPIGLHPILRLPDRPGDFALDIPFRFGVTFPADAEGMERLAEGVTFEDLRQVPARAGDAVDLSRLPLGRPVELVVQLHGISGPIRAVFRDAGAGVRIDWSRDLLPSVQIWLSDRALTSEPWRGTYRGVGVEPTAALFDLGIGPSTEANPVSARGVATALALDPAVPTVIEHRIEAFVAAEPSGEQSR